jgi:MYXO-CTERM domain-containing protein
VLAYAWTQTGGPAVALLGADSSTPAFTAPEVGAAGATLTFSLVVSDGRATSAPASVAVAVTDANRAPVVSAGGDFADAERSAVLLSATASDPDAGTTLTWSWTQTGGLPVALLGGDGATPSFTAPEVTEPVQLTFRVTVSDGGLSASDEVTVSVGAVNRPPVARAGPPQTVNARTVVTLDGGASSDPDAGTVLAFAWTQTAGAPVALTGAATAAPTFTAPDAGGALTFQVTVSDGAAISMATVTITVNPQPESGGGCGCSAYGSNPAGLVPFLFGLAFLRRRRARPAAR